MRSKLPDDLIVTALKLATRNRKQRGVFEKCLTDSLVYTLARPGDSDRYYPISAPVGGQKTSFLACFSNNVFAKATRDYYSRRPGNSGKEPQVERVNGFDLFFRASKMGLGIYLNPDLHPTDRYFFPFSEVRRILFEERIARQKSAFLDRSRQGRKPALGENTQRPIREIDFNRPDYSALEMAEIFGLSENAVLKEIAALEQARILDIAELSVAENDKPGADRIYDALVVFHVGRRLEGPRGEEFRHWLTALMQEYCVKRSTWELEQAELQKLLEESEEARAGLESALELKERQINELETGLVQARKTLNRLTQDLGLKDRRIAELETALEAAGDWVCPETVAEACQAAQSHYASRLVFHERVAQSVSEFSLKDDLKAAVETAKMLKALAEVLQPLKFERDNFSEERFQDETGLALSMTESRATKRDRAMEESRTCLYKGRKITFYPHLKKTVQGLQVRLYFQFLSDEKKILICHLGDHLPNAMSKYRQ